MSPNHHRNLDAATIYDSQLQKTKLLHAQPQQQETLTQPLHGDLQRRSCKTIARRKQETKSQLGTFRATARVSAPVAQASQFISATERPHTWKKHTVSRKSWHSNLILDVAVPRPTRCCQNKKESQHITQEQVAFEETCRINLQQTISDEVPLSK